MPLRFRWSWSWVGASCIRLDFKCRRFGLRCRRIGLRLVFGVRSQFRCEAKRSTRRASQRFGKFVLRPRKRPIPSLFFDRASTHSAKFRCRSVAAAGDSLSFASPKESKPRKGDPGVCVPSLRYGQPAVLGPAGVVYKLACGSDKYTP